MHRLIAASFAVLAVGLLGCNSGQPRAYRIAVNRAGLQNLASSCYVDNKPDENKVMTTNLMSEQQWVVWDGPDGKQYLDVGAYAEVLGHAGVVSLAGDVIEGTEKVFAGTRVVQTVFTNPFNNNKETRTDTHLITVTFEDMGFSPKGSIDLTLNHACVGCSTVQPSCTARLTFTGRRVDASNMAVQVNEGQAPTPPSTGGHGGPDNP